MSQILKLSCVSFRYVSISYVLANAHCPFLRGLRHSEMQGYVAAAGKKSRILEQDQRSWLLVVDISCIQFLDLKSISMLIKNSLNASNFSFEFSTIYNFFMS